jgi:hypothetical protein
MGAVLNFSPEGATTAYLDRGDRAERQASAIATAALDLRTTLLLALSTGKGRVPVVRRERIESEHIAETVSDVTAYDDVMVLLMQVLAHCPDAAQLQERVAALRERIVERVVGDRAADLVEFDHE